MNCPLSLSSLSNLLECNAYLRRFYTYSTGLTSRMVCLNIVNLLWLLERFLHITITKHDAVIISCPNSKQIVSATTLNKCHYDSSTYSCPSNLLTVATNISWLGFPFNPESKLTFPQHHVKAKDCSNPHRPNSPCWVLALGYDYNHFAFVVWTSS